MEIRGNFTAHERKTNVSSTQNNNKNRNYYHNTVVNICAIFYAFMQTSSLYFIRNQSGSQAVKQPLQRLFNNRQNNGADSIKQKWQPRFCNGAKRKRRNEKKNKNKQTLRSLAK